MLFDEEEVFKGLTAWFSSSVPESVRSQWVMHGGIQQDDVNDADYMFSSNAAAEDTFWVFESLKYQNEELTVFDSSLIEDTLAGGMGYLSSNISGSHILIHPAYQEEMDSFLEKCPRFYRSNVQAATVLDKKKKRNKNNYQVQVERKQIGRSVDEWEFTDESGIAASTLNKASRKQTTVSPHQPLNCDEHIKNVQDVSMEEFTREHHQPVDYDSSDEWDFKDEVSGIQIKSLIKARRRSRNTVDSSTRSCHVSSLPSSSPVLKTIKTPTDKQSRKRTLSNTREQIGSVMSPTVVGKVRGECLVSNSVHPNHCTEYVKDTRRQYEYGTQAQLRDVQYNMNLSDNSQSTDSAGASANPRSHYLSSMDDGVLHIDDIKLSNTPIFDFIPNQNGCTVDCK